MGRAKRNVLLHYHLFKNAGTSVDELLKANFPGGWVTREFDGQPSVVGPQVASWIQEEAEAIAFSSHTALFPPPQIDGVRVIPIIFVRHPIDRIASAYAFERTQESNSLGSIIAHHTTLQGYIAIRLALPNDRQCRDFHVARLAQMYPASEGGELQRAMRALGNLPFVGLVEEFDASMARLKECLAPVFPEFKVLQVEKNVTRDRLLSLTDRLHAVEREIGEAFYQELRKVNAADLALFETVKSHYETC